MQVFHSDQDHLIPEVTPEGSLHVHPDDVVTISVGADGWASVTAANGEILARFDKHYPAPEVAAKQYCQENGLTVAS